MFQPIQKLDEDIYSKQPHELDAKETSDVTMFNDNVVQIMTQTRYHSLNHSTDEFHPSNSPTRACTDMDEITEN